MIGYNLGSGGREAPREAYMAANRQIESSIQQALMARVRLAERVNPDFFWVYSYPAGFNLGLRTNSAGIKYSVQGNKARSMGLKRGLPDIIIDLEGKIDGVKYRKGWLELKAPGAKPRPDQVEIHDMLRAKGDFVAWSSDLDEAWAIICAYLGVKTDIHTARRVKLPVLQGGWEGVR